MVVNCGYSGYVVYKKTGDCFCYNGITNVWTFYAERSRFLDTLYETAISILVLMLKFEHKLSSLCVFEVENGIINYYEPVWDGGRSGFSVLYDLVRDNNEPRFVKHASGLLPEIDVKTIMEVLNG